MFSPTGLAIFAYAWWGLVPIYWKILQSFPANELILYRIILSAVFLFPLLFLKLGRHRKKLNRRILSGLFLSGFLIGFNWFLYVWAVNAGHVVETSLGYFLNPLLNIALGKIFFRDEMNQRQANACLLAAIGVGVLVAYTGKLPWIAILLAVSFAFYGFTRKKLHVPTIQGTFVETIMLTVPALIALFWLLKNGLSHTLDATPKELILLSFAGIITTVPLLAFAEATKHLTLSTMGFFQFIAPSLQFLLGVFVYKEAFGGFQWIAFAFIWAGLALFIYDLNKKKSLAQTKAQAK